jgi:hypothetical protein
VIAEVAIVCGTVLVVSSLRLAREFLAQLHPSDSLDATIAALEKKELQAVAALSEASDYIERDSARAALEYCKERLQELYMQRTRRPDRE